MTFCLDIQILFAMAQIYKGFLIFCIVKMPLLWKGTSFTLSYCCRR